MLVRDGIRAAPRRERKMKTLTTTIVSVVLLMGCANKYQVKHDLCRADEVEKNAIETFENVGAARDAIDSTQNKLIVAIWEEMIKIQEFIAEHDKRWPQYKRKK